MIINEFGGIEAYKLVEKLFPLCRSITGKGTEDTLRIISEIIPLRITNIPTGEKVFDWVIPNEWNITDAYIMNSSGEKVIDFRKSNLHIVNYSKPIDEYLSLRELTPKLYFIKDNPDAIPYRTTYYNEDWGFCLSYNQFKNLTEDTYHVVIKSTLVKGNLTYGEFFVAGKLKDEILFSTHICHPSMCNDNLSGISVAVAIAKYISSLPFRKYSYRIVFVPATIGAITWLSQNEDKLSNIKAGLVLALLGDNGKFNFKKSKLDNSIMNRLFNLLYNNENDDLNILNFTPYGYDERQYCSTGINLPVGRLTRTPNGEFIEYHTSKDDLNFVNVDNLDISINLIKKVINIIEKNSFYINNFPKGEPQLGRRGLYNSVAGSIKELELAMLWVLNNADGRNDLIDIANISKIKFDVINKAAELLKEKKIISELVNE